MSTSTRHGAVAQSFHWITAALVITAYFLGVGGPESRVYAAGNASALSLHETFGILLFAIVVLRLLWRLVDRAPEEPPMPAWMEWSARGMHWLLYALLVAIPVTAIAGAWFEGHAVTLLGVGGIGPALAQSPDLGRTIASLHTTLGSFIVWVAGAHALAALFHHFVLRDSVLLSMLPRLRKPAAADEAAGVA
jgi:cytochrome b561